MRKKRKTEDDQGSNHEDKASAKPTLDINSQLPIISSNEGAEAMQNSVVAEASLQPETGKENYEAEQAEEIEYFDPADG